MNYSDAERMAAVLDSLGYTQTRNEHEADLFIVISCSVRESAVLKIYGKAKDLAEYRIKNKNFRTILTGCVLEKDRRKLEKVFDIIFEIKDLDQLPLLLNMRHPESCEGSRTRILDSSVEPQNDEDKTAKSGEYLSIIPHYESTFRAFVPISTGCNNFCTYCAVPYTRGREKSRPMEEIVTEVKNLVESGYKEITLVGQNVNSYATENNQQSTTNHFVDLLRHLGTIPGDHRIYFYSNHPKDMSDELIETLPKLKHFPHYIHLPLQSGNDEIIRKMNRHYTKEQYLELVKKIREAVPDVTLTTDIIVGFPGETEEQFQDTADVMQQVGYDMAFIAQYSPRTGTVSAKLPDNVTTEEKKRREEILQKILAKTVLTHNQKFVGTVQRVLVDEFKNGKYYGRTEGYKVVEIVTGQLPTANYRLPDLIGRFIDVKIDSATSWKLLGTCVDM